jgi:tetratricopeptide (TPR) repeat protein
MDDRANQARALAQEAEALRLGGQLPAAAAAFRAAATLAPTAEWLHNAAVVHQLLGDHAAAEAGFREALALQPTYARARATLGLSLLATGRMAEGFACYDAWREIPDNTSVPAPDLGAPLWSGEDLAGKSVLVWGEEGFGDQIMYARFAPLLRAAGAQVIWVCNQAMVRLVREGLGMEAIAARSGALAIEGLDYAGPTSRLPVAFMQTLTAPPPAPYLRPPRPNVVEGLRIGVVTHGNPDHSNDHNRSLPPQAAEQLLALPGAFSLAPGDTGARDFWDTAGIIAGLELVICVDTSVAHLAGALGKPVWLLLPAIGCDWRWGTAGEASPWYGSMRLFRQTTPGDWSAVLAQVRTALGER